METNQAENPGPLPNAAVAQLFRELMSACMALEAPLKIRTLRRDLARVKTILRERRK